MALLRASHGPLKLARALHEADVPVLGTAPDAIDRTEDRKLFNQIVNKLALLQPEAGTATEITEAREIVDLFEANPGAGTIGWKGGMLDRPHLSRARQLLAQVED